MDINNGFVLTTEFTPASLNMSAYLLYSVATWNASEPIKQIYANKDNTPVYRVHLSGSQRDYLYEQ